MYWYFPAFLKMTVMLVVFPCAMTFVAFTVWMSKLCKAAPLLVTLNVYLTPCLNFVGGAILKWKSVIVTVNVTIFVACGDAEPIVAKTPAATAATATRTPMDSFMKRDPPGRCRNLTYAFDWTLPVHARPSRFVDVKQRGPARAGPLAL